MVHYETQDDACDAAVCILYLGLKGGGSRFSLQLVEIIKQYKIRTRIVAAVRSSNHDFARFCEISDEIIALDINPRVAGIISAASCLARLLGYIRRITSRAPMNVVVTMNSPVSVPVVVVLRAMKRRIVYVVHDATPHPGDVLPLAQRVAHRVLMACANEVVTLSRYVQERLVADGCRKSIRMVPLDAIEPASRGPHPAMPPKSPLALLFFGRLVAYKGLQLLHDALVPLRPRTDWRLTLAGAGPLSSWVTQAFAGWPQVTVKVGWLDEAGIDALIDAHHLLLCPYVEASQSGVVARAMARGLPAAVTPVGALAEQVGPLSRTLVARRATAPAFGAVVTDLLDDPTHVGRLSEECLALSRHRRSGSEWAALAGSMVG